MCNRVEKVDATLMNCCSSRSYSALVGAGSAVWSARRYRSTMSASAAI
jgi:hypothetical protein